MNKYQIQEKKFFDKYKEIENNLFNKRFERFDLKTKLNMLEANMAYNQIKLCNISKTLKQILDAKTQMIEAKEKLKKERKMNNIAAILLSLPTTIVSCFSSTASILSVLITAIGTYTIVLASFSIGDFISYKRKTSLCKKILNEHNYEDITSEQIALLQIHAKELNKQNEINKRITEINSEINTLENTAANIIYCQKEMVLAENTAIEKLGIDSKVIDINQNYNKDSRVNTIMRRSRKKAKDTK